MLKKLMLSSLFLALLAAPSVADPSKTPASKFACPMHPEVVSAQAGTCPKCKMKLVAKAVYVCPMHPEVTADKPGKCGKCKMALVKKNGGKQITK